jgi:hypothetical protein
MNTSLDSVIDDVPVTTTKAARSVQTDTWRGSLLNQTNTSPAAPTLIAFKDQLHAFWPSFEGHTLTHSASADGSNWPAGTPINAADSSPMAPGAAIFQGKLHLFWKANEDSNRIFSSASSDGRAWPNGRHILVNWKTPQAPAACAFKNKLHLFWVANDSNRIMHSSSSDGENWTEGQTINGVDSSPWAPAACVMDDRLYLFWRANDPSNTIFYSYSNDGQSWGSGRHINSAFRTPHAVSAAMLNGKPTVFWQADDTSLKINSSESLDGTNWPSCNPINQTDMTKIAPTAALSQFKGKQYIAWQESNGANRMLVASRLATGTVLRAYAIPTEINRDLDHTYVCASDGQIFPCWGNSQNGRIIAAGSGSATRATCFARNESKAGIVYGINGVCHQTSNRILYPASVIVNRARGYALSVALYGTYGVIEAISAIEWAVRKGQCKSEQSTCALEGTTMSNSDDTIRDGRTPSADPALEAYLQQVENLYLRHAHATLLARHIGDPAPSGTDVLKQELHLLAQYNLNGPLSTSEDISEAQSVMVARKTALEQQYADGQLSSDEYAKQLNNVANDFLATCARLLSAQDYEAMFGAPPGERIDLVNPDEME